MPAPDHGAPLHAWPGSRLPLGATWDGRGTNVAVWSGEAEALELCLDDAAGGERRVPMLERTYGVWHAYLPGVGPGTRYGFRAHGPWFPEAGHRFNPAKLLLDPYARAVEGELRLHDAVFGHVAGRGESARDDRDSAPHVPRSVVVDGAYDWSGDAAPRVPWADTVLYELHVRGFTMRHPGVPRHLRGTYAGLAHPAVLEHLVGLGVTTVELLPVHAFLSEPHLLRRGLVNYWGYNSVGFFAPHAAYSSAGGGGRQVREFRDMVRALHAAGLEVVLDVVYNHTAEGDERGPTLSLRGLGNAAYYRTRAGSHYADTTGCGNTLDLTHPAALAMVMDSLRYWAGEMHVDGFRFDLAPALARTPGGVDLAGPFLSAVAQDPVLRGVKLVAEPWDVGDGGYQLGRFPAPWREWNDRFRDGVRDHWRGAAGGIRELTYRVSGSSDVFPAGRGPTASVDFVTSHDGFTLRDLVSYATKHNAANGEGDRDGSGDNRSWNCGVEGETTDPGVLARRDRAVRNLLATLLLGAGVPMLTAGDEMGRTQGGNNNAYCQDNETSWVDWGLAARHAPLTGFTRELVALRREHPVFRRRAFFTGTPVRPGGPRDVTWYAPNGQEADAATWFDPTLRTLGMLLCGEAIRERGPRGEPVRGESFLLLLHGGAQPVAFALPKEEWAGAHEVVLDTAGTHAPGARRDAGADLELEPGSVVLLRVVPQPGPGAPRPAHGRGPAPPV